MSRSSVFSLRQCLGRKFSSLPLFLLFVACGGRSETSIGFTTTSDAPGDNPSPNSSLHPKPEPPSTKPPVSQPPAAPNNPCVGAPTWTVSTPHPEQSLRGMTLTHDLDGDGLADPVGGVHFIGPSTGSSALTEPLQGAYALALGGLDGRELHSSIMPTAVDSRRIFSARGFSDIDGDRRGELLILDHGELVDGNEWVTLPPGPLQVVSSRTKEVLWHYTPTESAPRWSPLVSTGPDVNGDAIEDVIARDSDRDAVLLSGANGEVLLSLTLEKDGWIWLISDRNGDGKGDLAVREKDGETFLLSGADGQFLRSLPKGFWSAGPDADGDGVGDFIGYPEDIDGVHQLTLYSGVDSEVLFEWQFDQSTHPNPIAQLGPDTDGDGLADVVIFQTNNRSRGIQRTSATLYSGIHGHPIVRFEPEDFVEEEFQGGSFGPDADGDGLGDLVLYVGTATQWGTEVRFYGSCTWSQTD